MNRTIKGIGLTLLLLSLLSLNACKMEQKQDLDNSIVTQEDIYQLPTWAQNATIYEVNLRQFTPEGSFKAFQEHLPRLKKMGIDILWFMPIYPISESKRKGPLGSPYSITDYKGLNPEFGDSNDFKQLVDKIHSLDMKIILDFVPNHTGWDSEWIKNNPEWYTQDSLGNVIDPIDPNTGESWGWTDVADLNYENLEMQEAMIESMKFWLTSFDVDGFRQDVAHQVPVSFWKKAAEELLEVKSIFLLAEAEVPAIRNNRSFHADYGWEFHHLMNKIAKGEESAPEIERWLEDNNKKYTEGFHMLFTSNHDENTWSGTVLERMGEAHKAMAVLSFTLTGMPLIYGGMEEPLNKRLEFFEKDTIPFANYAYSDFYSSLCALKHNNEALWNGSYGAAPQIIEADEKILAFQRKKEDNTVLCVFNLSAESESYTLEFEDSLKDYFTDEPVESKELRLNPWDFKVLVSN